MNNLSFKPSNLFLLTALIMLLVGLLLGVVASHSYILPHFWKDTLNFSQLRPMHVSSIIFWILLAATGCVYYGLQQINTNKLPLNLVIIQYSCWLIAIVGMFYSYLTNTFGGREYWEFKPIVALPIFIAWMMLIYIYFKHTLPIKKWPVYMWMWMTGIVFFMFTFLENYLWVFPYFRSHFIADMTIQWKVNGSLVGSWNQIIYGTAFFLMEKISNNKQIGFSKLTFGMYFLGLFNLMFNWGHHIYTLPTDAYIKHIGYLVSMTEWVFFIKIIYNWKSTLTDFQKHQHHFPYRFLIASEIWVFINMGQAILMSIPALNLYTHGTHVTVAHAMGTTIGINTMILLGACFTFLQTQCIFPKKAQNALNKLFWLTQLSLFIFWLSLNIIGIKKGIWQLTHNNTSFGNMMENLHEWFMLFVYSGSALLLGIGGLATILIAHVIKCKLKQRVGHKKSSFQINLQNPLMLNR